MGTEAVWLPLMTAAIAASSVYSANRQAQAQSEQARAQRDQAASQQEGIAAQMKAQQDVTSQKAALDEASNRQAATADEQARLTAAVETEEAGGTLLTGSSGVANSLLNIGRPRRAA